MRTCILTLYVLILTLSQASAGDTSKKNEKILPNQGSCSEKLSYMLNRLRENPLDGKICNSVGFYYYELGSYGSAVEYYSKAIMLSPEYLVSYNNLGVVYLKTGQLHLAEENFRRAIELDPKYIKAICNLAVVCFKLKKKDEALELYYQARMLNPGYVMERISRFKR